MYRLERYQESYKIYLNLIKNSEDDYEDEREANLGAVVARLTINDETFKSKIDLNETTFEQCYNKACILLGQRLYEEALEKLNLAEGNLMFKYNMNYNETFDRTLQKDIRRRRCFRRGNRI